MQDLASAPSIWPSELTTAKLTDGRVYCVFEDPHGVKVDRIRSVYCHGRYWLEITMGECCVYEAHSKLETFTTNG